jgi:hypothetical protein
LANRAVRTLGPKASRKKVHSKKLSIR